MPMDVGLHINMIPIYPIMPFPNTEKNARCACAQQSTFVMFHSAGLFTTFIRAHNVHEENYIATAFAIGFSGGKSSSQQHVS